MNVTNKILLALGSRLMSVIGLLDVSAAFDTKHHNRTLNSPLGLMEQNRAGLNHICLINWSLLVLLLTPHIVELGSEFLRVQCLDLSSLLYCFH